MFAVVSSAAVSGVEAHPVRVEAFVSGGLPNFTIVGLPSAAVQGSRERVRAALKHLGLPLPPSRIVVNLAPADLRKEGPAFDLPVALALLAADRRLPLQALSNVIAFGELALDGSLQPVRGAMNIAVLAASKAGTHLLAPPGNAAEVAIVPGVNATAPASLKSAVAHLTGRVRLPPLTTTAEIPAPQPTPLDLSDIRGQAFAKRALELAAAGRHNLLLTGPPGAGKTMLALRLTSILPPLTVKEAIEVARVHSSAGLLLGPASGGATGTAALVRTPPLRRPHHTSSEAGVLGGGNPLRPGEVSLAHRGVLFLDELPEFRRGVLEALRQPLEEGHVVISRAHSSVRLPARFQLVGARNPCPCGEYGATVSPPQESGACTCTAYQVLRYSQKLSGPLLDRFDLLINVPRLPLEDLVMSQGSETSGAVARRVEGARARMLARQGRVNSELGVRELKRVVRLTVSGRSLLREVAASGRLSGRGYDRLLRLALTAADLGGAQQVTDAHVAEAAGYRATP